MEKKQSKQKAPDESVMRKLGEQLESVTKKVERLNKQERPRNTNQEPEEAPKRVEQPLPSPTTASPPVLEKKKTQSTLQQTTSRTKEESSGKLHALEQRVEQLEAQTGMIASELESMLHSQRIQEGGRDEDMASIKTHMGTINTDVQKAKENLGKLFTYLYLRDRMNKDVVLRGRYKPGQSLRIRVEEMPYGVHQGDALPTGNSSDSIGSTVYSLNFP